MRVFLGGFEGITVFKRSSCFSRTCPLLVEGSELTLDSSGGKIFCSVLLRICNQKPSSGAAIICPLHRRFFVTEVVFICDYELQW